MSHLAEEAWQSVDVRGCRRCDGLLTRLRKARRVHHISHSRTADRPYVHEKIPGEQDQSVVRSRPVRIWHAPSTFLQSWSNPDAAVTCIVGWDEEKQDLPGFEATISKPRVSFRHTMCSTTLDPTAEPYSHPHLLPLPVPTPQAQPFDTPHTAAQSPSTT
jgi:hypothetical protein